MSVGGKGAAWLKRFFGCVRGNTAMMFALSSIALVTASGAAVDVSRTMVAKTRLSEALDAAALAVGSQSGLSQTQAQALAQKYFDANYPADSIGRPGPVSVTISGQAISLSVNATVPTTLLKVAKIDNMSLGVTNQVVRGITKLRVALALDNTGSMAETDSSGTSKISALKTATKQLLDQLKAASLNPGDVQVAIIPFSKDVNVGKSQVNASWLDWTEWEDPDTGNGHNQSTSTGIVVCSGSKSCSCKYYSNCTCSGTNSRKVCTRYTTTTVWVPDNHNTWEGCITDRDQPNDTKNTTPTSSASTKFPTENEEDCPPAEVSGLGYDWNKMNSLVNTMKPQGNTNQTIGLAWAWQALTQGAPLNAPSADPDTTNLIILLSDGLNTENHWTTSRSSIDARMGAACDNAKAAKIVIYTVLVMAGNSNVLQNCASDRDKYFELSKAGEVVTAFNTIGTELANLHLSK
jgi:Flp pilus assembly protein TadG